MQNTQWRTPVLHIMSSGNEAQFPTPKDFANKERSLCDTSIVNPDIPEDCVDGFVNTQPALQGAS